MNFSSRPVDGSLLLWFLGVLVYWMAAHVMLGSVRQAQRQPGLRQHAGLVLSGGLALGTALCAGAVLALTAAPLKFLLGFRIDFALGLWAAAVFCTVLLTAGIAWRPTTWVFAAVGVLMAALAGGIQAGWLASAGLRPGLSWQYAFVAAAAALVWVGVFVSLKMAFSEGATNSRMRGRWRAGASAVMGLSLVVSQEVLLAGTNLLTQVSSVYAKTLTAQMLSLALGAVVPMVLAVVMLDMRYSRRSQRLSGSTPQAAAGSTPPARRRRRKYRIRGL